jgi:flagellar hook assembly protein FlgD
VSEAVATSLVNEVITGVSNFPNPFDSRKGGPEGQTQITYTLGAAGEVDIVIYDLLGYVVKSFHFNPGESGGRQGANFVAWDGKNGMGQFVAKGGYIARIKVGSSLGTATVIRKIGVIH